MSKYDEIMKLRNRYIDMYQRKFYISLRKQMKPVLDLSKKGETVLIAYELEIQNAIQRESPVRKTMENLFKDIGIKEFNRISDFVKSTNVILRTKTKEDLFQEILNEYIQTSLLLKEAWINSTTKSTLIETVTKAIQEGVDQGKGTVAINKLIRDSLNNVNKDINFWRAQRIAQTEVISASNSANYLTAKTLSISDQLVKKWLVAPGNVNKTERHRLLLGDIDKQRPGLDQPFFVDGADMLHPGDPRGGVHNVVNCKCAFSYEVLN